MGNGVVGLQLTDPVDMPIATCAANVDEAQDRRYMSLNQLLRHAKTA
jgi:hypothetical protein